MAPFMGTTLRPNGPPTLGFLSRTTTAPCWSILSVKCRRLSTLTTATPAAVPAAVAARTVATVAVTAPRAMVSLPPRPTALHLLQPVLLPLSLIMDPTITVARSPCGVQMRPSPLDIRKKEDLRYLMPFMIYIYGCQRLADT